MGREVRRVPPGWEHPTDEFGDFKPLFGDFLSAEADFLKELEDNHGDLAKTRKTYGEPPVPEDYMPIWAEGEATLLCMYETCTEGTPISPAFETPEELARWLADTGASAFGYETASYESWLATIRAGWSVSAVGVNGHIVNGVAYEGLCSGVMDRPQLEGSI
jgi:hypothetical protein